MNHYDCFCAFLKEKAKALQPGPGVQRHHILPLHAGGHKKGETVLCTLKDYGKAHLIRYKVFGSAKDKIAGLFILHQTAMAVAARQALIVSKNRALKQNMFDATWQKIQANKIKSRYFLRNNPDKAKEFAYLGGKKSGQVMTPTKMENLKRLGQNVGTNYGKIGGLKKQSSLTKEKIQGILLWKHDTGVLVKTSNLESLAQVKDILCKKVPDRVKHTSGLSAIVRRTELHRYGWQLIDTVISSEAGKGDTSLIDIFD